MLYVRAMQPAIMNCIDDKDLLYYFSHVFTFLSNTSCFTDAELKELKDYEINQQKTPAILTNNSLSQSADLYIVL